MFERTDPKTLVKWLILAAIIYFLLPYDLLPDVLGIPGRIDDLLIMAWLAWFYRSHVRQFIATGSAQESAGGSTDAGNGPSSASGPKPSKALDAYEVLGITRTASPDEIQAAYRSRMQEYHPDKVAHLGEALQKLAHEKSQQIQRAYRELR